MSDLPRTYTGPGLVDMQVNGYAGLDFNGDPAAWSAERFSEVAGAMARRGVVAAAVTLITDDSQAMIARAERYRRIVESDARLAASFPLLHLEGPFISPVEGPRGAHPKEYCRLPAAMPDLIDRLQDASGGRVGVVTLAPELPGAIELVARLAEAGVCVGIGHTQAGREAIDEAVAAGAKLSTHLGNGSHQDLPRLDNYVQAQLADDRLLASFIADGHHMPFGTLKNFIRAKTPARSILVTDAISAAEMPPGAYQLSGERVLVEPDGRCAVPGKAHLAGSTLTLDRAVMNVARHCGVGFQEAWRMASGHPAGLLGLTPPEVTVEITERGFVRRLGPRM